MNAIPPADLEAFAEAIRAERPDMEKLIDIAACATAAAMMFAGRCIELQRVVDAVNDPERVQGARILAEVCRDHNMSVRWLRRGSRDNLTVAARRDACVRLFKAGLTKSAVGRLVGIDHSSVGHALKRANGWVPPATRTPRTNLWTPRRSRDRSPRCAR